MYACFQGLSPRTLIGEYKAGLRKNGVARGEVVEARPVSERRPYRMVQKKRLTARLGLTQYDCDAPLVRTDTVFKNVKIMLSQHIGVPCVPCVKAGDKVDGRYAYAKTPDGKLGVGVHALIGGEVNRGYG